VTRPKISLFVPTFGTGWYLATTIASAFDHATEAELEALVYAQMGEPSTKDVVNALKKAGYNARIIAESNTNEGVSVCVNECSRHAMGDFFFYTGDDYAFLPGWDAALLRHIRPGDYQYLTPRSIEPTGTNPTMYAPFNFGRTPEDFDGDRLMAFWNGLKKQDVVSCAGPPFVAAWLWKEVGGFDESYWWGLGTDPDFAAMCRRAAQKVNKPMEFRGVGDSGAYHFQCLTTSLTRTPAFTEVAHARFQAKWGFTTRELAASIGDGRILD
jgi:glycosyltransferase involved in cell wall biosynthesis